MSLWRGCGLRSQTVPSFLSNAAPAMVCRNWRRHPHGTSARLLFGPRSSLLDLSGSNCKESRRVIMSFLAQDSDTPGADGSGDASGALKMTCGGHSHAAEQEVLQVKEGQEVIPKMCNAFAVSQDQAFRDNGTAFV